MWRPPRNQVITTLVILSLLLVACSKVDSTLTYLGVKNAPAPSAVEIDVLCDYGSAPCTPERLRVVADAAFSQVALRPGSVVRLWWLGNSVGETTLIASMTIPPSRGTSLRAREAHRDHLIAEGRALFEKASAPLFADFIRRKSPLLESIGKIALAGGNSTRQLWLVSDLLEESLYRFECGALPDEDAFRQTVGPILPQDSLRNVTVFAVYASPDTIDRDRCPVSVERFRAIATLYESAITTAGGSFRLSATATPTIGGN
jgi:hypothetical protein